MHKMKFNEFVVNLYESETPTEKRTWGNIPKYSTGKPKMPFTQWLGLKGQGSKGYDGKFYGWSHRAVHGFAVGDTIKPGTIGNKYQYSKKAEKEYMRIMDKEGYEAADEYQNKSNMFDPYKIKNEKEAKEHALRFANSVS